MPSLGADMESGTVAEWLVQPGDSIHKGDIIAVIDTDKALIEVESFHTGVVDDLLVGVGERVPVGTPLARISGTGAEAPTPARRPRPAPPESRAPAPEAPPAPARKGRPETAANAPEPGPAPPPVTSPIVRHLAEQRGLDLTAVHGTGPGGRVTRTDVEHAERRVKASPLARKLATELGVVLGDIQGTGITGAIRAADVRAAAREDGLQEAAGPAEAQPMPPAGEHAVRKPDGERRQDAMRQVIARVMAKSKREIPHYYLSTTVDLDAALTWLRERNRDLPVPQRTLPAALLLKAAACASKEVPELNGFWIDDAFVPGDGVHVGVAISLKAGGLIAPALHDVAERDLDDVMADLRDLVTRSRAGRLRGTEMTEATITVTNLGDLGVEAVHGIIYPPQVALVGFGKILDRPWAVDGLLGVRPVVTVTLAGDHRATDGFTGARFLAAVDRLLNHPEEL
ncbi:dihydrolipoamide acetyltransferase family protein [Nonomuraea maheshkhaliensis]|uniref:Dihydrolipoamide acetyltransferase component of pyruvate dehydrogenase complex n=1 Tax=Nonomuraea maheshkhaliensis TaxID=419590 RepID=A0ABN2FAY3_9ACTN